MNPLRIRAQSYRTFRELDVELPDGCVAVLGENGAGKSSVINVIDYALFGAESRSLAELLTYDGVAADLEIELTFEHAGWLYRVRRGYSAKGRGKTTVDFEREVGAAVYTDGDGVARVRLAETWTPLTCESARETDALISRTIGLTRTTFRASAFLAQGDGAAFTDCPPAKRKEVLAEVLGLGLWQQLQEHAKTDRRTGEAELQRLTGETAQARDLVATKNDVVLDHKEAVETAAETSSELAQAEAKITELEERYRAAAETAGKRHAVEAELAAARAALEQLQQRNTAADAAARALVAATLELQELPASGDTVALEAREAALAAAVEEHARASRERDELLREHDRLTRERDQLVGEVQQVNLLAETERTKIAETEAKPDATCGTCGQHVAGEAKAKTLTAYRAELDAHVARSKELYERARAIVLPEVPPGLPPAPTVELEAVRVQLRTIRASATTRAQLEERIRQNETAAAAGPLPEALTGAHQLVIDKQAALDDLEPVDLDTIKREGEHTRTRVTALRTLRESQTATVTRLAGRLELIADAEQRLTAAEQQTRELQAEVDLCMALEKAYGRDGIPALVIENSAIPSIETEAARILGELGGSTASCRVELRTLAERKSADGLRDTLDVIIVGEQGERAYETFSGGERTRINLALRIALARLLAHRRGAESRLLAIDEPEFLDEQGTSALVDVLRGLAGDFDRVYLISHVPSLRDSFDDVITVVKDGDRSHVELAGGGIQAAVVA